MPIIENLLGKYALSGEVAMDWLTDEERTVIEKFGGAIHDLESAHGVLGLDDREEHNKWIYSQAYQKVPEAKAVHNKLSSLTIAIFHSGHDG